MDKNGNDSILWGAQVDPASSTCIIPSQLLSTSKDDFQEFLIEYLSRLHEYACRSIETTIGVSRDKLRHCLTMENCYKFFRSKEEMQEIAVEAQIIKEKEEINKHPKRLLLINREDASAIYHEKLYFSNNSRYFWKIDLHHQQQGNCRITFNSIEYYGGSMDSDGNESLDNNIATEIIKSIDFKFDFMDVLMNYLHKSITKEEGINSFTQEEIRLITQKEIVIKKLSKAHHEKDPDNCEQKLRNDLLHNIKVRHCLSIVDNYFC
jgi:hypothetical protein